MELLGISPEINQLDFGGNPDLHPEFMKELYHCSIGSCKSWIR